MAYIIVDDVTDNGHIMAHGGHTVAGGRLNVALSNPY